MLDELKQFLTTLGNKLSVQEVEQMLKLNIKGGDEVVDCEGILYF